MSARRWLPLIAACIGTFLLLTYATITTIAVPAIAVGLDGSTGAMSWVVDAYTLALAALLVGMGALGDAWGRKRLYICGLVVFLVATAVCAIAPDVTVLVVARGAQGIAGAAMFATLLPLLGDAYSGRDRHVAFAAWGAVAGLAAGIGNVAGGLLTQFFDWRAVFYFGIPVAAVALAMAVFCFADSERGDDNIDWAGIVLFTLAAVAAVLGVTWGGDIGWASSSTALAFLIAIGALTAFVFWQRRGSSPMLDPALFRSLKFDGVLVAAFGYYLAAYGPLVVLSLWLQNGLELSASAAALVLSIQPLAFVFVSALCGSRLQRVDLRLSLGFGTILCGIGCVAMLYVLAEPVWPALIAGLILTGVGSAMVSPVLPGAAMSDAPAERAGTASATANSSRQFGLAVGIALCGSLFVGPDEFALLWPLVFCAGVGMLTGLVSILLFSRSSTPETVQPIAERAHT